MWRSFYYYLLREAISSYFILFIIKMKEIVTYSGIIKVVFMLFIYFNCCWNRCYGRFILFLYLVSLIIICWRSLYFILEVEVILCICFIVWRYDCYYCYWEEFIMELEVSSVRWRSLKAICLLLSLKSYRSEIYKIFGQIQLLYSSMHGWVSLGVLT